MRLDEKASNRKTLLCGWGFIFFDQSGPTYLGLRELLRAAKGFAFTFNTDVSVGKQGEDRTVDCVIGPTVRRPG